MILYLPQHLLADQAAVSGKDEISLARHVCHETLCDEICIGACGRDDAHPQVFGQCPDRGEGLIIDELTRQNGVFDLLLDLLVDRDSRGVGDDDPGHHDASFLYMDTIYSRCGVGNKCARSSGMPFSRAAGSS